MTLRSTDGRMGQALHTFLDCLYAMLELALPLLLQRSDLCLKVGSELLEVGELGILAA